MRRGVVGLSVSTFRHHLGPGPVRSRSRAGVIFLPGPERACACNPGVERSGRRDSKSCCVRGLEFRYWRNGRAMYAMPVRHSRCRQIRTCRFKPASSCGLLDRGRVWRLTAMMMASPSVPAFPLHEWTLGLRARSVRMSGQARRGSHMAGGARSDPERDRRSDNRLTLPREKSNGCILKAGGQAGYAADCKSVETGSIPVPASRSFQH